MPTPLPFAWQGSLRKLELEKVISDREVCKSQNGVQKPRMRNIVLLTLPSNSGRRGRGKEPGQLFPTSSQSEEENQQVGLNQRHQESKPVHTDCQPIGKEKHGGWGGGAWMSRTRPLHTSANHERRTKKKKR